MEVAVYFYNFTGQDFSWPYNNETHKFLAGSKTILRQELAAHFAKHFCDWVMNNRNEKLDHETSRIEILNKCIIPIFEEENKIKFESKVLEESMKVKEEKNIETKEVENNFSAKKLEAEKLGIKIDKRWGEKKLDQIIAEKLKEEKNTPTSEEKNEEYNGLK